MKSLNCNINAIENKRYYMRCERCIMDTSDPNIIFDKHGICNYCTEAIARIDEVKKYNQLNSNTIDKIATTIRKSSTNKK